MIWTKQTDKTLTFWSKVSGKTLTFWETLWTKESRETLKI